MSEFNNDNNVAIVKKNMDNIIAIHRKPPPSKSHKLSGPMKIIKVALYMLRNKKGGLKNKSALPATTNTALNKIMGSVGPLYLQSNVGNMSPPPPPLPPKEPILTLPSPDPVYEASPNHPIYAPSSSSSRCTSRSSSMGGGMSSRYASALSLYDLDNHDDDIEEKEEDETMDDGDAYYDGLEGDELIDAKAEMFIAKFYQQMRLQN